MKECSKCGEMKALSEYHRSKHSGDGRYSSCGQCKRKSVKEYRQKNRKHARAVDRDWYKRNQPQILARKKKQMVDNYDPERRKRTRIKNPEKEKAKNDVNNALQRGKLDKPSECSQCGATGRIEGHHKDYSRPLDVVWLCPPCHHKLHRLEREAHADS